jgi:D-alanyl-lipoteichoic acid acyltransferase DltB (MBOAT superfamily)
MNFTDDRFLWMFLGVFVLWRLVRNQQAVTIGVLAVFSVVFYGYYVWEWVPLLLAYCVGDWALGLALRRARRPRLVLGLGVVLNLAGLACCKYTPLVISTLSRFTPAIDSSGARSVIADWVVPCGISFYCFTGIAYLVDVYRGDAPAERSLWRFTLFMSFFPQLVAGPILRARDFLRDLQPGRLPVESTAPLEACALIARGYVKKLILADRIAFAIDPYFAHVGDPTTAGVWSLPYLYLYALQIYLDFSAYTDIARGLGLLFGFRWPENFANPYAAPSIQEFWRRWHITLSLFLRDYLYIPLGGGRRGELRAAGNLMLTMLLGGLWHGASWSFVLWGGLHGVFLIVHRIWSRSALGQRLAALSGPAGKARHFAGVLLTFHAVCFAWCFFRLTQLPMSLACAASLFDFETSRILVGGAADSALWLLAAVYGLLSMLIHYGHRRMQCWSTPERPLLAPFLGGVQWGTVSSLFLLSFVLSRGGDAAPFIYFQF